MVRLGVPEDQPLAVQQWQGLIAINYPARAHGLGRHVTATEAKKVCPDIILQHVATWKFGETEWAYRESADLADHKVSLDPYRMQSKKIFAVIREFLPALQKVEKASIDEVFCDLSAQVHSILLERFPELRGPPPYDDPTENLPCPPTTALDWQADCLIDVDENQNEEEDPDWDDVIMWIGSEIVGDLRAAVKEKLRYTCSGGVARNKMLAKLGSDYKKPNAQTVIRNRAVQQFMSGFKFTKIRNLGGKLGDEVVAMFNTDTVKDLLEIPLSQLQKLGDDTGSWLYNTIRGEDHSEINPRTQIKSMLSAKSFRPSVNTFEEAVKWLRIFVADIFSRCVEEGVLENKRRPKTVTLHHRQGGQTRSKQSPIPQGKVLSIEILFNLSKDLLAHVVADGRAWPCANLSLSVGGFEDGTSNNKGIGNFLVRGDEAKALMSRERETNDYVSGKSDTGDHPGKRRRVEKSNIQRFLVAHESSHDGQDDEDSDNINTEHLEETSKRDSSPQPVGTDGAIRRRMFDDPPPSGQMTSSTSETPATKTFPCQRCRKNIRLIDQSEHLDWHFAKDLAKELQDQEEPPPPPPSKPSPTNPLALARGRGRPPAVSSSKLEKGQKRLAFGKG